MQVLPPFFRRRFGRFISRKGQTLVEYTLILAVISVVCLGVLRAFEGQIVLVFSSIQDLLDTAQSSH